MKFISWNVNGLRACVNKGFLDTFYALDADFFCLQETKLQEGQISLDLPGYEQYWCYAEKKGYSGTAIFTKHTPLSVAYGLGVEELDTEGRLITLEYPEFYLVTCYTPNAQRGLARIDHRLRWESAIRAYLKELDRKKPVILCGDLNVAHKEIDLKNPGSNRGNAGFSDEERGAFTELLECGFTDSFRYLYPEKTGAYSWWSYMFNARANNAGWRIDYFVVSDRLKDAIHDATIHPEYLGSDHCPVGLDLNISCNGSIWSPEITQSEKTDSKQTGGDHPAGPLRSYWGIAVAALLTLAVLVPGFFLLRQREDGSSRPTDPPQTADTQPVQRELITEVIDRTGTVYPVRLFDSPTSSVLREGFTNGDETWELDSGNHLSLLSLNFHIQLVFDPSFEPQIQYTVSRDLAEGETIDHRYYYDADHRIAGCFLFGSITSEIEIQVTAACSMELASGTRIPLEQQLTVCAVPDPSENGGGWRPWTQIAPG